MKEFTVQVNKMMCGMCEKHVNEAVKNLEKVKSVESSHTNNQTVIIAEDDFDVQTAVAAIVSLGYEVGEIQQKPYCKKSIFDKLFKK